MNRNISLYALMLLMLTACHNPLEQLTPIEQFPGYILDDMDVSVVQHLEQITELIKQNNSKADEQKFDSWLQLAHALHGYELFESAEMAYKNALLFKLRTSVVEYQLAHLYKLQSNYKLSNELLNKVANQVKDYAPAYNNLAENLYDQGSLLAAKEAIKKSLQIDKVNAYALQISANIDGQLNDTEAAIEALQQALAMQPKATKLYSNLAQLYQSQGQLEAAEAAREKSGSGKLTTSDPWLSEVTMDLKGYNQFVAKAQVYMDKGDYKTALKWANMAASDRPDGFTIQMLLGVLKVRLNQPDQALQNFRQAHLQRPDDFKVNLNLGTVYKQQGEYQKSLNYYRKAMDLDPQHLVVKINYADSACLINQLDKAMEVIEELKSSDLKQQALFLGLKCLIQHKKYLMAHQWVEDHIAMTVNNISFIEYAVLLMVASPIDEKRNGQLALNWLKRLMSQRAVNKHKQLLVMALMEVGQFEQAQKIINGVQADADLFLNKAQLQQLLTAKTPYRLW